MSDRREQDTRRPLVTLICGTRPNFVKIAALHRALSGRCRLDIVHTGQHYSANLSDVFFRELGLPDPDLYLNIGSGTHGRQTADALIGIEQYLMQQRPALMIAVGDVNSTLAAALAAAKCGIVSAHVEAGLRSHDRSMPEEINRVVADHCADWLYTPTAEAALLLQNEGIDPKRIVIAGNVMIDTLEHHRPDFEASTILRDFGLRARDYVLMTMHRPGNVDHPDNARKILTIIRQVAEHHRVVFPIHPRTRVTFDNLLGTTAWPSSKGGHPVLLCDPLGYTDFLALQNSAFAVLTDSGGVQEETTALGVRCLTLRPNTERPITVTEGTNTVVGLDPERVMATLYPADPPVRVSACPALWDGHAAERIAQHVVDVVLAPSREQFTDHGASRTRLTLHRKPERAITSARSDRLTQHTASGTRTATGVVS
jgi:UDP-N-acetylglucosamine 2-epimerase (non-hydrolysing)